MTSTFEIAGEPFGAWVVKRNPDTWDLRDYIDQGNSTIDDWNVAENYRSAAMAAGQPAIFWVTGTGKKVEPGLWGVGWVTGPPKWEAWAEDDENLADGFWIDLDRALAARYIAQLDIAIRDAPVPRAVVAADPLLGMSELFRIPYQSNPSFLSAAEYGALLTIVGAVPAFDTSSETSEEVSIDRGGAAFGDADTNRVVEQEAMRAVVSACTAPGRAVRDVSAQRLGWDITVRERGRPDRHVEVKGVSGTRPRVLLTRNEMACAEADASWELAVVTRALTAPSITWYRPEAVTAGRAVLVWQVDLDGP